MFFASVRVWARWIAIGVAAAFVGCGGKVALDIAETRDAGASGAADAGATGGRSGAAGAGGTGGSGAAAGTGGHAGSGGPAETGGQAGFGGTGGEAGASTFDAQAVHYVATPESYSEKTPNLDAVCISTFGSEYRLLDWNEITSGPEFIAATNMQPDEGFLVQWNGQRFFDQTRHFFMARHDHNPPGNFMIHADIDNSLLDLGSWYGINMRVACYRP